jgi:hypothetical protein
VPCNFLEPLAEEIELLERGVNVWSHPDTLKLFVDNWRGKNFVLIEEVLHDGIRVCPLDVDEKIARSTERGAWRWKREITQVGRFSQLIRFPGKNGPTLEVLYRGWV